MVGRHSTIGVTGRLRHALWVMWLPWMLCGLSGVSEVSCLKPKSLSILGNLIFSGVAVVERGSTGNFVLRWEKPVGNSGAPEFLVYMQRLAKPESFADGSVRTTVNMPGGIAPAISGALLGIVTGGLAYEIKLPLVAGQAYAFQVRFRADGKIDENKTVIVLKIPPDPTPVPTDVPTVVPTPQPTPDPTSEPTITATPTATETVLPTETATPAATPTALATTIP